MDSPKNTSWHKVGKWYHQAVGESGHFYHQSVIFPRLHSLFPLSSHDKILDLGCGNGIFTSQLPKGTQYVGVDSASSLLKEAQNTHVSPRFKFVLSDVTQKLPLSDTNFTAAIFLLSLQNMDPGEVAILNASRHLLPNARLCLVLNHPMFRIPRQSSWEIDPSKKTEFRRIDRYLTPLKIPITAHPGQNTSQVTWSFHHPLSDYVAWLSKAGFVVNKIEEWASSKTSVGKAAKMENRARSEFPLFLSILATKL